MLTHAHRLAVPPLATCRPGYRERVPVDHPTPPPLPRTLADPRPVIAAGTAAWAVALVVFLIRGATGHMSSTAIATCAVGAALGAVGYGIFFWQRRAVRRGDLGSQQGIN